MQHYSYMVNVYKDRLFDARLQERADRYVGIMKEIAGVDVRERCRRHIVVVCREMVAYRLLQGGATLLGVGAALGMSHSVIVHYRTQMNTMFDLAYAYRDEMRIWEAFNEAIEAL